MKMGKLWSMGGVARRFDALPLPVPHPYDKNNVNRP